MQQLLVQLQIILINSLDDDFTDFTTQIEKNGFISTSQIVTTNDHQNLMLQQISHNFIPITKKYPILLVHGLLDSSFDFFQQGKDKAVGFNLVMEGQDVWAINVRGNQESQNPDDEVGNPKQWWFTMDEMADYDLPSTIEFINRKTGLPKVHLLCHSQGTQILMLLGTKNPQIINDNVDSITFLSPVLSINNIQRFGLKILLKLFNKLFREIDPFEFIKIPKNFILKYIPIEKFLLKIILKFLTGMDSNLIDQDEARRKYLVMTFGQTSSYNFAYWAQKMTQELREFDLNNDWNMGRYNSLIPPKLNLSNLSQLENKIRIQSAGRDPLGTKADLEWMVQQFKKEPSIIQVDHQGHCDWFWDEDANNQWINNQIEYLNFQDDNYYTKVMEIGLFQKIED